MSANQAAEVTAEKQNNNIQYLHKENNREDKVKVSSLAILEDKLNQIERQQRNSDQRNLITSTTRHSGPTEASSQTSTPAPVIVTITSQMSPTIVTTTASPPFQLRRHGNDKCNAGSNEEHLVKIGNTEIVQNPKKRLSAFLPYWSPSASTIAADKVHQQQKQENEHSDEIRAYFRESQEPSRRPSIATSTSTITLVTNAMSPPASRNIGQQQQMCSIKCCGYEEQIVDRLSKLYRSPEFTDVILSCEGHQIRAHKLVLAMCSPFFWKMFQDTPCKHPFIIVNGIKIRDLQRVIQFIYVGQVKLNEEEIDDFIEAAESLGIDGVNTSSSPFSVHSSSPQQQHEEDDERYGAGFNDRVSPPPSPAFHRSNAQYSYQQNEQEELRRSSASHEYEVLDELKSLTRDSDDLDNAERTNDRHYQKRYEESVPVTEEEATSAPEAEEHYPLNPKELKFHKYFRNRFNELNQRKPQDTADKETAGTDGRKSSCSVTSGGDDRTARPIQQRKDSVISTCKEISPSTTPRPVSTDEAEKSMSVKPANTSSNSASPVDMSMGNSALDPGPRLPPPPWYSPPSKSSATSPKSTPTSTPTLAPSEDEIKFLSMHESHRSSVSPIHIGSSGSNRIHPYQTAQRHSFSHSHVYGSTNSGYHRSISEQHSYRGEENSIKRSTSKSPESQSYQLHLPEATMMGGYSGGVALLNSSSRSGADQTWITPPVSQTRHRKLGSSSTGPFHPLSSSPNHHMRQTSSINGPASLSTSASQQFLPLGASSRMLGSLPYPMLPQTSMSSFSFYGSNIETNNSGGFSNIDELQRAVKVRTETTTSNMSNLRMRLSGISPSSIGSSLGSSGTNSSSSSASANSGATDTLPSSHTFYRSGSSSGISLTKPRTKAIRSCQVPQEFRYTAQEVDAMVEQVENYPGPLVPCAVCSKFVKRERLRAHIHECHLLQGEKIICQYCGIALKSKGSYRVHIWRHKRGNLPTKRFKSPNNSMK